MVLEDDHYVYVKPLDKNYVILFLNVVDILLAGNNKRMVNDTKQCLFLNFEMKYRGETSFILGVKIVMDHSKRVY